MNNILIILLIFCPISVYGQTLLSDNKIGERNLGTSLQFESRFEFGYKTTNTSSSLNIFHYSNAGTASDNSGVNILMINLSHLF